MDEAAKPMSAASEKSAHPTDIHVGKRIRLRRRGLSLSQHELAALLNISFQQVQKYESGGNRISASRIFDVARVMKVPVAYFFSGIDGDEAEVLANEIDDKVAKMMAIAEGIEMVEIFPRLIDAGVRRKLVELAKSIESIQQS
jgi:transcriptional regulator with XRE-family HTH domain